MTLELIAFFVLAVLAIGGAVFMINFTQVMHMALSLAFTFFSVAGIFFLLDAEFIAVIQILIYAGGVSVLMIFGIMLTKHSEEDEKQSGGRMHQIISFLVPTGLLVILTFVIYLVPVMGKEGEKELFTVQKIAEKIFNKGYVLPFELTSLLLLVALIGAIILAKREEKE